MARNFRGIKSLLFLWILSKPQKFYPRNYLSLELFVCDKALSVTLIEVTHHTLFFHRQKLRAPDTNGL